MRMLPNAVVDAICNAIHCVIDEATDKNNHWEAIQGLWAVLMSQPLTFVQRTRAGYDTPAYLAWWETQPE